MNKFYALAFSLFTGLAGASPTITADAVGPGPGQPTSCTVDASGRAIPCLLLPVANGFVKPSANAYMLAAGTYTVTMTYTNAASSPCTGGPVTFTCDDGGGPATSTPITMIVSHNTTSAPAPANVKVTFP